ncbi:MAG: type II secretion system F family protein [Pseudomonadota bacterium]
MAAFRYKAVAPTGEMLQGEMEAGSAGEVIAKLQEAGNMPISADPAAGGLEALLGSMTSIGKRVSAKDVGEFTQQLATLLGAGLPLDRAMHILLDLSEEGPLKDMVQAVRDQVRGGSSLSDALEAQHGVFSRLYINMVRAGEAGGTLDVSLEQLAEYLERAQELKNSVVSAMIYPIILLAIVGISLFVLLGYVVPQFMPIFEELGAELPLITQIVLGAGEFLQQFWWGLILAVLLLVTWVRGQFANPNTRLVWDGYLLRVRLLGKLIGQIEMARFTRTVGTLLTNGVPMLGALSIGRKVMTNTVMAGAVGEAAKEVKTGGALAHNLAKSELFPKLALQMISVGEETGKLDEMLVKVADTYDTEVRLTIDRLMAALVPILILGLAAIVAVIVMSILVAILSLNNLVA